MAVSVSGGGRRLAGGGGGPGRRGARRGQRVDHPARIVEQVLIAVAEDLVAAGHDQGGRVLHLGTALELERGAQRLQLRRLVLQRGLEGGHVHAFHAAGEGEDLRGVGIARQFAGVMDGAEQARVQHAQRARLARREVDARPRIITVGDPRHQHHPRMRRQLLFPGLQHRREVRAVRAGVGEHLGHLDHPRRQRLVRLAVVQGAVLHAFGQPRQGRLRARGRGQ
ncbi:hypothetical protein [Thermomonas sp. S9]|uniref:hypothetical protein n=1 Tax=Thermomonas sp. S9 TaxID=2885203 RepID=UPI00216B21FB|nr:hypothetical protein [Thermomonas sp. S9]